MSRVVTIPVGEHEAATFTIGRDHKQYIHSSYIQSCGSQGLKRGRLPVEKPRTLAYAEADGEPRLQCAKAIDEHSKTRFRPFVYQDEDEWVV